MMWRSLMKLRDLPDDTEIYCGHEYTAANIRFARTIEPDNPVLAAREAQVKQQIARRRADDPGHHRRREAGQSVPARRSAGGRGRHRHGRQARPRRCSPKSAARKNKVSELRAVRCDHHRRRHHPRARARAAPGRRPLSRDLPRSAHRSTAAPPPPSIYFLLGARRALALAPHRRRRDLALLRRRAAQARSGGRRRRRRSSGSAPTSMPARCRNSRCRRAPGRRRKSSATGRWSAARSRPAFPSTASSWRRRTGRRATKRDKKAEAYAERGNAGAE